MDYRGYPERDLVSNRSSLLLYGGTEAERRLWAEEAAQHFAAEGPLRTAHTADELAAFTARPDGVVYVPDATALSHEAQRQLMLMLRLREERPKVILGMTVSADTARDRGLLTNELHYALQVAQVDLAAPGLKDAIQKRRARRPQAKKAPARAPKPAKRPARPAARAKRPPPRKRSPKPKPKAKAARKAKPAARKARPAKRKPAPKKSRARGRR